MTVALVVFLLAAVIPVFFGKLHAAPVWLTIQAGAIGWIGVASHEPPSVHGLLALAEVIAVRALIAPQLLRGATRRRAGPNPDLMPSNLFAWAVAAALIVLAFRFGAPDSADGSALTLGAVGATVAVAVLLLAANDAPPAQLVALLFMENALALFESLLPQRWPLPVHVALSAIYLATVAVGCWLIGQPERPAAAQPPATDAKEAGA